MNIHVRKLLAAAFGFAAICLGWAFSGLQAQLLVHEDFSGYTNGEISDKAATGLGLTGTWTRVETNVWAGTPTVVAAAPHYVNIRDDLHTTGKGFAIGGGRISVDLTNPITSGQVWISFVMGANDSTPSPTARGGFNTGSFQVWFANTKSVALPEYRNPESPNADDDVLKVRKNNIIAGYRLDGGVIEYVDVGRGALDPIDAAAGQVGGRGEAYAPFGVENIQLIEGADPALADSYTKTFTSVSGDRLFWVINVDIAAKKVYYYVFAPGADIKASNGFYERDNATQLTNFRTALAAAATWKATVDLHDSRSPVQVGAIAMAYSPGSTIGNIRIGRKYFDVSPTYNCQAHAPMAREAVTVDGVIDPAWDDVPANPIAKAHSATQPANEADLSGYWKAMWTDTHLYVLGVVTDDNIIRDAAQVDEFEIFTEANFTRATYNGWGATPRYSSDDTHVQWVYRLTNPLSASIIGRGPAWPSESTPPAGSTITLTGVERAVTVSGNQYILEVAYPIANLGLSSIASGDFMGFEVQVNDRDPMVSTAGDSDGKKGWCDGANRAWASPHFWGTLWFVPAVTPAAEENFEGYVVDEVVQDQGEAGDGWAGPWYLAWQPSWTAGWADKATAIKTPALSFAGDLLTDGQRLAGNNSFARVGRQFANPVTSGSNWASFVMSPGSHLQIRLGMKGEEQEGESKFNPDTAVTAGFTMAGGQIQYLDTSKGPAYVNPDTQETQPEVYLPFANNPYPKGNIFCVVNVDAGARMAHYYVFAPGDDVTDLAAATWKASTAIATDRSVEYDSIALFTVFSTVAVSNLRFGESYEQVSPPAPVDPIRTAAAVYTSTPPSGVADEIWTAAKFNPITLPHGGRTFTPEDISGSWKALWDATNLYLLYTVTDDDVIKFGDETHPQKAVSIADPGGAGKDFQNDEVEIFTDGGYDRIAGPGWPPVYDFNDVQWVTRPGSDGFFSGFGHNWQHTTPTNPRTNGSAPPAPVATGLQITGVMTGDNSYTAMVTIPWSGIGFAVNGATGASITRTPSVGDKIGIEVQLNDRDRPREVDGQGVPLLRGTTDEYIWPNDGKMGWADGANNAWHHTASHGTLYLIGPAVLAYTLNPASAEVPLAGGSGVIDVSSNYQFGAWTSESDAAWLTVVDGTSGVGAGSVEWSAAASTSLYNRSGKLTIAGVEFAVTQAGTLPAGAQTTLPNMTAGETAGSATHPWLGDITVTNYPWIWTAFGWEYVAPNSTNAHLWLYDLVAGWWLTGGGIYPFGWLPDDGGTWIFVWPEVTAEGRWIFFYADPSTGEGEWSLVPLSQTGS